MAGGTLSHVQRRPSCHCSLTYWGHLMKQVRSLLGWVSHPVLKSLALFSKRIHYLFGHLFLHNGRGWGHLPLGLLPFGHLAWLEESVLLIFIWSLPHRKGVQGLSLSGKQSFSEFIPDTHFCETGPCYIVQLPLNFCCTPGWSETLTPPTSAS